MMATSTPPTFKQSIMVNQPDGNELVDYWNELHDLYKDIKTVEYDESQQYEEGEMESDWLQAAGLGTLAIPFAAGREITDQTLEDTLAPLPHDQAAAVRKRVRILNRTVRRQKGLRRGRKPDIRDVFRDFESSNEREARSRSATPDSLDSGGSTTPPRQWTEAQMSQDVTELPTRSQPVASHTPLSRVPSAPISPLTSPTIAHRTVHPSPIPIHELFKNSELHWADIASNTEGIELISYQKLGTIQGPRLGKIAMRSTRKENDRYVSKRPISRSNSAAARSTQQLSFEHKFHNDGQDKCLIENWPERNAVINVVTLSEVHLKKLLPLVWLDLATLFDCYNLPFQKRKPSKKKRKEENEVFGVPLITLVRKDILTWGYDEDTAEGVPRMFSYLTAMVKAHRLIEGILRVPGNKQKVEQLCNIIERSFYSSREDVERAISGAGPHDAAAILKRFLRDLPQPLLTSELLTLFYQTHMLTGSIQRRALNLLVLLLPMEHRATLYELLLLSVDIVSSRCRNKMTDHNVAMIITPILFPPNYLIKPSDKLDDQISIAANSCRVTEALMRCHNELWMVPPSLLTQAQKKQRHYNHGQPR